MVGYEQTGSAFAEKGERFSEGINTLLTLRQTLLDEILSFKDRLSREDFSAMLFSPRLTGITAEPSRIRSGIFSELRI